MGGMVTCCVATNDTNAQEEKELAEIAQLPPPPLAYNRKAISMSDKNLVMSAAKFSGTKMSGK